MQGESPMGSPTNDLGTYLIDPEFIEMSRYDQDTELHQIVGLSQDERFNRFFQLKAGQTCEDGSVIVGESGYLFVNDGSNRWKDQLTGKVSISDEDLQETIRKISLYENKCREIGVDFSFVVYPEKDIAYPEFSPNVQGEPYSLRSVHRIASGVSVNFVYPEAQMVSGKFKFRLFHRRNSHVEFYGGLLVANALLNSIGLPSLSKPMIKSDLVCWPDDLSIKWVDGLNTMRRRVYPVFERFTHFQPENGHVGTQVETVNPGSKDDRTVIVFGDSYSWNPDAGLVSFLAVVFRRVYFIWSKEVDWEIVERVKPNIMILESAERFLIRGVK